MVCEIVMTPNVTYSIILYNVIMRNKRYQSGVAKLSTSQHRSY